MENFNEVLTKYGVRMHRGQKKQFREYLQEKAKEMGYQSKVDKSLFSKNVVIGDIDKADIVFTAHYDTPPRMPKFFMKHMVLYSLLFSALLCLGSQYLPQLLFELTRSVKLLEISLYTAAYGQLGLCGAALLYSLGLLGNANKTNYNDNSSGCISLLKIMDKYKNLPTAERDKIAFVFFDNEEKGLLGSSAFKNKYRKIYKNKTFVNLDCVGLGKQMNLFHFGKTPNICKDIEEKMYEEGIFKPKIKNSSFLSLSDHFPLRKANHVCLIAVDEKNNNSLYEQIHSANDNKIDYDNINAIVSAISKLPQMPLLDGCEAYKVIGNHENIKQTEKYMTKKNIKPNYNYTNLDKTSKTSGKSAEL